MIGGVFVFATFRIVYQVLIKERLPVETTRPSDELPAPAAGTGAAAVSEEPGIPHSIMPGPPRPETWKFLLDTSNSQRMTGHDDPENERWSDVAGNYFSDKFIRRFRYTDTSAAGPVVRVRYSRTAETLKGRLEAHRLKPNTAYQLKLLGDYRRDKDGFETIGYQGRWRLPGGGTNFSDEEYGNFARKVEVEAYILFDYFVTDARGDAVREFYLDSSLHVLWNATRQGSPAFDRHNLKVLVSADNPAIYARPKSSPSIENIWAEREGQRYRSADQITELPPRTYRAKLVLTEESLHSPDRDGGRWATVFTTPIDIKITGTAISKIKHASSYLQGLPPNLFTGGGRRDPAGFTEMFDTLDGVKWIRNSVAKEKMRAKVEDGIMKLHFEADMADRSESVYAVFNLKAHERFRVDAGTKFLVVLRYRVSDPKTFLAVAVRTTANRWYSWYFHSTEWGTGVVLLGGQAAGEVEEIRVEAGEQGAPNGSYSIEIDYLMLRSLSPPQKSKPD